MRALLVFAVIAAIALFTVTNAVTSHMLDQYNAVLDAHVAPNANANPSGR